MKIFKIAKVSDEAKSRLKQMSFQIIDEKNVNGRDIVLAKYNGGIPFYEIGFQDENLDFSSFEQQQGKFQPKSITKIKETINEFKKIIDQWIAQYGKLYIGSMNEEKTKKYLKILSKLGYKTVIDQKFSQMFGTEIFYIEQGQK